MGEGIVNVDDFEVSVEDGRWAGGGERATYSCRVLHRLGKPSTTELRAQTQDLIM